MAERKVGEVAAGNRGKGRVKGVPNKLTKSAKEAFAAAFDGLGGATRLQEWAEENTTEFYKLYARLIPTELASDPERPLGVVILPPVRHE